MLNKLEKIFSIITGILTILIALWVLLIGQCQFKANLKISEAQLKLAGTEREQTIESGSPILAISTSGFTPVLETNYFEFLLKLQNYGERPAFNIGIQLYTIGSRQGRFVVIDKLDQISANPMTKGMQWDIGANFTDTTSEKIFIYAVVDYADPTNNKKINASFLWFIPERKYLKSKIERGLFNASPIEKDNVRLFLDSQNK